MSRKVLPPPSMSATRFHQEFYHVDKHSTKVIKSYKKHITAHNSNKLSKAVRLERIKLHPCMGTPHKEAYQSVAAYILFSASEKTQSQTCPGCVHTWKWKCVSKIDLLKKNNSEMAYIVVLIITEYAC